MRQATGVGRALTGAVLVLMASAAGAARARATVWVVSLLAGVLLALSTPAASAQTYDDLRQAVDDLTEVLVLGAKANGVEIKSSNESVYVSPCDFHERGSAPSLRLSKHLADLFSEALRRLGVTVVATRAEGEEMFLRAEWTREVEKEKLVLQPRVMQLVYMEGVDRKDPKLVASKSGRVHLKSIDGSHFEPDPTSPCDPPEPIGPGGETSDDVPGGAALGDVAEAFEKAKEANTVAAFELVAKHFPETFYGELAQKRADALRSGEVEFEDWTKCKENDVLRYCEDYLEKYRNGAYVQLVQRRIDDIREVEFEYWTKCKENVNLRYCEDYLEKYGNGAYVQLVQRRIDDIVDAADPSNLIAAVVAGDVARVKTLLGAGADSNAKNAEDQNARPLHLAAVLGNAGAVDALLAAGADPDATADNGWTPLHSAAWKGKTNTIKALLAGDADPNAKDDEGMTVLGRALREGHTEAADALRAGGAADEGPDSCEHAHDGECDEPGLCRTGTDTTDCEGPDSCEHAHDGECDEPGLCRTGTDTTDCEGPDSCEHAHDGECDEPGLCRTGTDTTDCEGPDSCEHARDGECDEPGLCRTGTDTTDCEGPDSCEHARDGECDEPGLCRTGTDTTDCNAPRLYGPDSCEHAHDGECDEPGLCRTGTDTTDCNPPQLYCCNALGIKSCLIVTPGGSPGAYCFCYGLPGSGYMCY